jgi:hypothetical protein
MKDPVSGIFRVSDWYDAHPSSSPPGTRLTGVIIADGLAPTPADAPVDHHSKWVGQNELPVTVDRTDPSNFRIEWDQVIKQDWRATAQQHALDEATKLAGGVAAMDVPVAGSQPGPGAQTAGLSPTIQRALHAAGIDLNAANSTVHIETTVATPDQARAMMASFFGGQNGQPGNLAGQFMAGGQSVATTGVVRDVHDVVPQTPMPPGTSQADLTLDVRRPDGSTYPATTRIAFRNPARRAAIATVGTTLPLLVDPNDPGRLSIDVGRLNLP